MFSIFVLCCVISQTFGGLNPIGLVPMLDGRIVGGETTTIDVVPWQISMKYYGSHRCGGSVFKPNVIITAAHCVDGVSPRSLHIVAGTSYKSEGGVRHAVKKITAHPKYSSVTIDCDIALVFLDKPYEFNSKIQPVVLPDPGEELLAGSIVRISGWGALSEGGSSPNILQHVDITVVTSEECKQAYMGLGAVTDNMVCAGEPDGGRDSCQGDSGGPVVVENKLVGIVSWGYGCARPKYPGVYARVAALRIWIDENI